MFHYFFGQLLTSLCVFYGKALGSIVHTAVAKFGRPPYDLTMPGMAFNHPAIVSENSSKVTD